MIILRDTRGVILDPTMECIDDAGLEIDDFSMTPTEETRVRFVPSSRSE